MTLLIVSLVLTILAGVISYFLAQHPCWRWRKNALKIALVVTIIGAASSFVQGFRNQQRADEVQNKLGAVECVQSQITKRHFTPEQRSRLVNKLAPFLGTVANVWMFSGGRTEKIEFAVALVDVFREAKWKTNGVTTRLTPVPFRYVTVRQRASTNIDAAVKALVDELTVDCITAVVSPPFTDNGDFGSITVIDNSGAHPDTSQATIFGPPPLQNPDISRLVGDGF